MDTRFYQCDDGTFDILVNGECVRENVPAAVLLAAPAMLAALQECITDDGANCLAYGTGTPKIRCRLAAINAIARAAISKAL